MSIPSWAMLNSPHLEPEQQPRLYPPKNFSLLRPLTKKASSLSPTCAVCATPRLQGPLIKEYTYRKISEPILRSLIEGLFLVKGNKAFWKL